MSDKKPISVSLDKIRTEDLLKELGARSPCYFALVGELMEDGETIAVMRGSSAETEAHAQILVKSIAAFLEDTLVMKEAEDAQKAMLN